ncbi:MAG: hypothetical protein U0703_20075 [Anaerolineae bacterium]
MDGGERVTDRLFFLTNSPPDPATWRLRVGWVDSQSGALLPVTAPNGTPQADAFALLPLK